METRPVVLVVEDETVSQCLVTTLLERKGYLVRVAASGAAAMAAMECDPVPDAVILDLHLPDQSGYDVCRALRLHHPAQELPILFMSSHSDIPHRAEGLHAGASDYLSKPVDGDELAMRLGTHLALVTRTRELAEVDQGWQEIFNALTDAVTLLDRTGQILKCNQAMAHLVGLPITAILGKPCHELMHHLEGRIDGCPFLRMMETRSCQRTLMELNERWHEITVEPLWDSDGHIRGGVHRIRDIHDRVMAEEARKGLLASERRWRAMAEVRARLVEAERTLPLHDLLTVVLDEVSSQVESPIGFCHFYDEETGNLTLQQWSTRTRTDFCRAEGQGEHHHVSRAGVWVDCLRERRPVIHNDYLALPNRKGLPRGHAELIRELVVPVFRQGRIVALLGVGNKPDLYTEHDLEAVQYLADLTWDLVERKSLDQRRAEEEAKFKALFNHSPDGVFLLQREPSILLEVNPRFAGMLGFTSEDLLGSNLTDLDLWVSHEDRDRVLHALEAEGRVELLECRLRHRDGVNRWVLLTLEPVTLHGASCLIGTLRDISRRKALEVERAETQANLDALFRSTGDFVWSVDPYDRLLVFNEPLAHYFQAHLGVRPWRGALPEDGLPAEWAALWRSLYARCRREGAFDIEYPIADGRSFAFSVNPVHHPDGSLGVSVFGRDVSAWRKAERELAVQRDAYEALFEQLESGFAVYEIIRDSAGQATDYRLLQANGGLEALTGLKREGEMGLLSAELRFQLPPEVLRRAFQVADTGLPMVLEGFNASVQRHLEVHAYRPAPDRVAMIFTDISARKRMEQDLQRSRANLLGIMESTVDWVWSVDAELRLLAFNGAFARQVHPLYGGMPVVGDRADACLSSGGVDPWEPLYRQAMSAGAFRIQRALPDGRTFEFGLNPILEEGRPTGVAVFGKDITHRLKAESELLAHHAVLEGILESSDAPVFSLDRAYRYTSFNQAHVTVMEALYGSRIRLGDRLEEHQGVREDWLVAKANLDRALSGEAFTLEAPSGPEGPRQRCFQIRHQPIRNEAREVTGVAVFAADVTESFRKQQELERLQEMLQQMQRIAKVGAWEVDLLEGRLRWSEGVYRIYELSPEDYTPEVESSIAFYAPESQPVIRAAVQRAIETGEPFDVEVEFISAKGRRIWVKAVGEVDRRAGRPERVFGSFLDIDAEKRASMALQASEANLLDVGRLARVGGWRYELRTQELTWTQVTREIHEVLPDFVPTVERAVDFYAPEAVPIIQAAVQACITEGRAFDVELPLITATGKPIWVRAIGAAESDPQGFASIQGVIQDVTALHWAEEHVAQLADLLRTSQRVAKVGGWEVDLETGTHFWTEETYRIHQVDPNRFQPCMEVALDFYTPESRSRIEAAVERLVATQEAFDLELEIVTGTGQRRWVQAVGEAVVQEGRTVKIRGSFRDIQAQKDAEQRLQASERRMRAIFETTADGLVLLDKQTLGILDANPAFCRTYGYTVEELRTLTALDMSAEPEQTEQATRESTSRVRGRRHRKKDGAVFPVDLTAGAFEEEGRIISVVSCRDISEQERVLEALQDSEERLELVLEGAQLGFWDWDIPSGRVVRNAQWAEMLGYTLGEVPFSVRQWTDLHHPDDRAQAWHSLQDHLEGRTAEHRIHYRMQAKDGGYRWILDQARVVKRDAEGRPLRMCGTHTDVTAMKAVESALREHQERLEELVQARTAQLESANQELEAFSYSVSHDLRAPLRSILGFSEALEEDFGPCLEDEARAYLNRIKHAARRMGDLIEDLLRLSRVARQDCVMEPVDLSRLAWELCEGLALHHPEHPVAWHVAPGLTCRGDQSLLRIALENLLTNAWKFTSRTPSPQVWVDAGQTGDIQIRDNGAGFPVEKASQLFVPFRRLHHQSEFAGTGLGLATVRRILARHGGSILAEGHPGEGACFTLRFPPLEE